MNGKSAVHASVTVGSLDHGKLHKDSAGNEVSTDAKFDKQTPKKKTKLQESQKTSSAKTKQQ